MAKSFEDIDCIINIIVNDIVNHKCYETEDLSNLISAIKELCEENKSLKKELSEVHHVMSVAGLEVAWTCRICGYWRPDKKISVISKPFRGGHANVRYCNDNENCEKMAIKYLDNIINAKTLSP